MRDGVREELIGVKKNLLNLKKQNSIWFKISPKYKYCPELHILDYLEDDDMLIDISYYFQEENPIILIEKIDSIYNFIKECNPDNTNYELGNILSKHLAQLCNEKGFTFK